MQTFKQHGSLWGAERSWDVVSVSQMGSAAMGAGKPLVIPWKASTL